MKIIYNKKNLINSINKEKNIGFVPTMGCIHNGHLSLVKKSKKKCKITIVSIYVNKSQFNKKSDFLSYPRKLKSDISLLKRVKIDYLFVPKDSEIYPDKKSKRIKINTFSRQLCGLHRPGHFNAVVDVIDRFAKIIKPKMIFMGEKDMQQLKIVEDYLSKNFMNIKVINCKTIREKNGIALSSRNQLLTKKEKDIASKIYSYIHTNKKKIIKRIINTKLVEKNIFKMGVNKIDYVKSLDVNKIIKPYKKNSRYKIFIAYYFRSVRLIDNI